MSMQNCHRPIGWLERAKAAIESMSDIPAPCPKDQKADWLEQLPACVVIIVGGRLHYANQSALKLMEADTPDAFIGHAVSEFVHPLDQHRVLARIKRAEDRDLENPPTEFRAYSCAGRELLLAMTSNRTQVSGGPGVLAAFLDMSRRADMEFRMQETDQNFRRMMNTMQDVYYRTDVDGVTAYVCPAVKNVLGFSAEEIVGLPAAAFYPDAAERDKLVATIRQHGSVHDFPGRMRRKDGVVIDISISTHALFDEQGQYAGVEGIWRDISERKAMERRLERLATRDDLTDLPNRRNILDALDAAFARRGGRRDAPPLCIMMLDLDHFKHINDAFGHRGGDLALKQTAVLMDKLSRKTDCLGRLGGEEFLLVLEDADLDAAIDVAQRIRRDVAEQVIEVTPNQAITLTVSIGVAQLDEQDQDAGALLERADSALYDAKGGGRNRVCAHGRQPRKAPSALDSPTRR